MKLNTLLTLATLTCTAALAQTPVKETFEGGLIYSQGSGDNSKYEAAGMSVAGGWLKGNHRLQLQVAALMGETTDDQYNFQTYPLSGSVPPANLLVAEKFTQRLDHFPIWINYRYGLDFGPADKIRVECGPTAGMRINRLYTKGHITGINSATLTKDVDSDYTDSSGELSFDYGVGGSLSYQLSHRWRLIGGLSYIMTTSSEFEQEAPPLNTATTYAARPIRIDAHATTYGSISLEYTF